MTTVTNVMINSSIKRNLRETVKTPRRRIQFSPKHSVAILKTQDREPKKIEVQETKTN